MFKYFLNKKNQYYYITTIVQWNTFNFYTENYIKKKQFQYFHSILKNHKLPQLGKYNWYELCMCTDVIAISTIVHIISNNIICDNLHFTLYKYYTVYKVFIV